MSPAAISLTILLAELLRAEASPPEQRWLDTVPESAKRAIPAFVLAYGAAGQAGRHPLVWPAQVRTTAESVRPTMAWDRWSRPDAARALLLLSRNDALGDGACLEAAVACYTNGDAAEQQSWLRGVSLLPSPERLLPLVIDACRSNILPVFQAVACGNPFPAQHFADLNFNQMVLKALFNNLPLADIVGLPARRNAELARMASDYADERRSAGRTIPADIGLAL